jgi:hypothetical protein
MTLNPYESPRELDEQPDPGVGCWRDGDLLVMHVDAELPRYCIHTNQPADGAREFFQTWRVPGSLLSTKRVFWLPQVRALLQSYSRERSMYKLSGWLLLAAPVGIFFGIPVVVSAVTPGFQDVAGSLVALICLACGGTGIMLWRIVYSKHAPLRIVHAWRDYVWFARVHPGFLDRLPEWPRISAESKEG